MIVVKTHQLTSYFLTVYIGLLSVFDQGIKNELRNSEETTTLDQNQLKQVKNMMLQITEVSRKGDGIARIQGFVIFVKNGKVGQNAKIRVVQVGNRFAQLK